MSDIDYEQLEQESRLFPWLDDVSDEVCEEFFEEDE